MSRASTPEATARAICAHRSRGSSPSSTTLDAITPAAAGVLSPMKKRRSTVPVWTLKRASRRAPQITNRKAPNHAGRLRSFSAKEYMRNAGATQKETTSASESNSTPNWLVAFIRRATRPSSRSMTIATKMASAASEKRPSTVSRSAKKPQKRLPVVRRLGRRTMPRPRFSRSSFQRRRRDAFARRIILDGLRRSRERAEDGDAAHHPVTGPHAHLGAAWHDAVGARAEADHPEALAGRELVTRSHAADDAPGNGARDLHDRDAGALPLEIDDAPLVHATGVGLIGGDEAAPRIRDAHDQGRDGRAVDVDVERRQEDRDAHGRTDEGIVERVDRHHAAVGRGQHRAGNGRRLPLRVAEEAERG